MAIANVAIAICDFGALSACWMANIVWPDSMWQTSISTALGRREYLSNIAFTLWGLKKFQLEKIIRRFLKNLSTVRALIPLNEGF